MLDGPELDILAIVYAKANWEPIPKDLYKNGSRAFGWKVSCSPQGLLAMLLFWKH